MVTTASDQPARHLAAFAGYGIELEYMLTDANSLAAKPIADRVLERAAGRVVNEFEHGPIAWSNELVLHVIELKTNGPAPTLAGLDLAFHHDVQRINELLEPLSAALLPGAMHPLFHPDRETRLWPHGQNEIYQAYDRIFGCRGHGWSNLQSMHINLPFANDAEFTRLHAAIRVALPLIPALAASSPLLEGVPSGWMDTRLKFYRQNQCLIPEISGRVVPEPVTGIIDYHQRILEPMYRAIADYDPDHILAEDWLNSRGAIARFDRQTIEIRVIDIQECPRADLALADVIVALVRALYEERWMAFEHQQALNTENLSSLLDQCAVHGAAALVEDPALLAGLDCPGPLPAGRLWQRLLERDQITPLHHAAALDRLLQRGTLSEALLAQLGRAPAQTEIVAVYRELVRCLAQNELFHP